MAIKVWNFLFIICACAPNTIGIDRKFLRIRPALRYTDSKCRNRVKMTDMTESALLVEDPRKLKLNPLKDFDSILSVFLFGNKANEEKVDGVTGRLGVAGVQYASGNFMRAELFRNVTGVHKPNLDYMVAGQFRLNLTKDRMQTAVNAFSIFIDGNMNDILQLPPKYVLNSARTIAMLKIAQEKLAATWTVVKNGRRPDRISHATLEAYRPLFKYVNGREIARLNLSDSRILKYIGTHPDLTRHQVGVIASKYIKMNKGWTSSKYLNQMNNLLCGVPMLHMRRLEPNTFLQLSHQVFYHIHACDPIQRRFYLKMMTRTEALGRAFSWSARDVARLGLLLAEVSESDLTAIKPQAMAGITPQVMLEIPPKNLKFISEAQIQYIDQKSLNIMAKKLKAYHDMMGTSHAKYLRLKKCLLSFNFLILFMTGSGLLKF
ncbi:uncharacterized protein LOC128670248 [Plodia interpunctella]|uniref:uncharacterized protein LOC128670248 n=1 Tax=Plodia interpunctella TaxID=58824 RepID=UPI00236807A8|nr:uncharacterized protein LOC128670248 [Plodia interpunctella]